MRFFNCSICIAVLCLASLPSLNYGDEPAVSIAAKGQASTDTGIGKQAIRIVPQLSYENIRDETKGLYSPSGRFVVARSRHGLAVLDVIHTQVGWLFENFPLKGGVGFAFSHDEKVLAVCYEKSGGFFLDLKNGKITAAPWLKGFVPVFSPDNELVYITTVRKRTQYEYQPSGYVDTVCVYNRNGKRVATYVLKMNIVGRLSFSKNKRKLIVYGGIGVGLETRGGGTFTLARQTIDIATGLSFLVKGKTLNGVPWPFRDDCVSFNFKSIPKYHTIRSSCLSRQTRIWDEATSMFYVNGLIWNLRTGTVVKKIDLKNVQHLRPQMLIGTAYYEREKLPPNMKSIPETPGRYNRNSVELVTVVNLQTGEKKPVAIHAWKLEKGKISPDGRYIAHLDKFREHITSLEIWDINQEKMIGHINHNDTLKSTSQRKVLSFYWLGDKRLVILVSDSDGKTYWEEVSLACKTIGVVKGLNNNLCIFSPNGSLVAQHETVSNTMTSNVVVKNIKSGRQLANIKPKCKYPRMFFVDDSHLLLVGTYGDPIQLFRVNAPKALWEMKSPAQSGANHIYRGKTNIVLNYGHYRGSDILDMKARRLLPVGAKRPSWRAPILIRKDRLAIDPIYNSTMFELRETATGKTVATFAAKSEKSWIIYTPNGFWKGTPDALDFMKFYQGARPLSDKEIEALHKPEVVQRRLRQAFQTKEK